MLEIVKSPSHEKSSDFDEIWYTQHLELDDCQNINIFKIQDGGRMPYKNRFFWP